MRNLKKFVYLREFNKVGHFDFSKLTLKERLLFSAILTKYRYDDERSLVEIIWNYDGSISSFRIEQWGEQCDELITDIYDKGYAEIVTYIKKNAKVKEGKKYMINSVDIDYDKIFLTRNGYAFNSMNAISCKAFILCVAESKYRNEKCPSYIYIYDWCEIGKNIEPKTLCTRKTKIQNRIKKWTDEVGIEIEFDHDLCVIKGWDETRILFKFLDEPEDESEEENNCSEPSSIIEECESDRQLMEMNQKQMAEQIVKCMKDANISDETGSYCIVYSKNRQDEKPVIKIYCSTK